MRRKVLFIFPNTANSYAIPSAIAILAGIAKDSFWHVGYFDTCMYKKERDSMEDRESSGEFKPSRRPAFMKLKPFNKLVPELQNKIDAFKPDIIAISCMSFEYAFLLTFFPKVHIPDSTLVVIGGIHAILEPDEVAGSGLFDLICTGEGEEIFREILSAFGNREKLGRIKNIYMRDESNGAVIRNPKRMLIDENRLWESRPDYSLFDERYFWYPFDGKLYRRFSFETGRGCPYDCSYCGNAALRKAYRGLGKFVRTRPVSLIKKSLPKLIAEYKVNLFYFQDECFLFNNVEWLSEFVDWYGKKIKKPFIVQTRAETVTKEKIKLLKKMNAPFFQVSIGVESGSEKILSEVCNRKTSIAKTIEAFDLLGKYKVRSCAFFMVGLPYETRKNIFESIRLCKRIRPSVAIVSIFQPMPGQKLRMTCIKEGFIRGNEPLHTFTGGSMLTMPQISPKAIADIRRVFLLYAVLPQKYYPMIEKCESDYEGNKDLYERLVKLRWAR